MNNKKKIEYQTPGVYINETPLFPPTISRVPTTVPVFIGYTENADEATLRFKPKKIYSLIEYINLYGKEEQKEIIVTVNNDEFPAISNIDFPQPEHTLYHHIYMFFANGGRMCYIISVGDYAVPVTYGNAAALQGLSGGLQIASTEAEITLLAIPEAVLLNETDYSAVVQDMLSQCNFLQNRFAIVDVYNGRDYSEETIAAHREMIGGDHLKYGASYFPYLKTTLPYTFADNLVRIMQPGGELDDKKLSGEITRAGTPVSIKRAYELLYNAIASATHSQVIILPPSAAMAGIYARVDDERGVWKAPANIRLAEVTAPTASIDDRTQNSLNIDVTGKSINAIRYFTGKGTLVWGARTLDGNNNEWRYISVRRFFIMVEEAVKLALAAFAFEPNDANNWVKAKAMIENFMVNLWRQGALQGTKPEEAFFVKAGLGETMTMDDILNGRMIVKIGMAPVRPAEFIIICIAQIMQQP